MAGSWKAAREAVGSMVEGVVRSGEGRGGGREKEGKDEDDGC